MAIYKGEKPTEGVTFSRGAAATAEGVSNAAKQGIVNNVQTSKGKAVKGSTLKGQDVSGMAAGKLSDPNEVASVTKEAAAFNAMPNPFQAPAPITQPYQSKEFTKANPNDPTLANDKGEKVDYNTYLAQGGKKDFSNVRKAFEQTMATGIPAPQSGGEARGIVAGAMEGVAGPNFAGMEQQLAEDPDYAALLQTKKEFSDIANQRESLTQEYSKMSKKLGIDEINTELINTKRILEGTEDDIRTEVTKAGGFATESQVQAMTFARNKQQIKNYNNLLETKQMAMEQLGTMMNLSAQDRQFAMQAINQKLQIDTQIMQYKDKMKTNAVESYDKIVARMGYDGLQSMANGDPYYESLIEKTMGLGAGGLSKLAAKDVQNRAKAEEERVLDLQLKKAQISATNRSNRGSGGGGGSAGTSALTQAIIKNPSLFNDLTPTERGKVISELSASGYNTSNLGVKGLSDTAIMNVSQTQKALEDLSNLKGIIQGNEDKLGPIKGLAALNPWSSSKKIQADVNRVRQTVGKALEGGVLRKEDEEKYKQILSTLTDTPSTALYKIDALTGSISRDLENYKSLQQSAGRSLDVGASLQVNGPVQNPDQLRSKYNY